MPTTATAKTPIGVPVRDHTLTLLAVGMCAVLWLALRDVVPASGTVRIAFAALTTALPPLLACRMALLVSRRVDMDSHRRLGWTFIACGAGAASVFAIVALLPGATASSGFVPAVGAVVHHGGAVLLALGLLHWVRRRDVTATAGMVLDLACVGLIAVLVSWKAVIGESLAGAQQEGFIDELSMVLTPALGSLLLVAVVLVFGQAGRTDLPGAELMCTAGIGALIATDLAVAMHGAQGGGFDDAWLQVVAHAGTDPTYADLGWTVGFLAVGIAALRRVRAGVPGAQVPLIERSTTWEVILALVPFALMAVAVVPLMSGVEGPARIVAACLTGMLLVRCALVAVTAVRSARASSIDPLTGARNHRTFQEELPVLVDGAVATGQPLTLAVLDIDDFSRLNDTISHAEGDRFLRDAAWTIRHALDGFGVLYRSGGDEFTIALPDVDRDAAFRLLRNVADAVADIRAGEEVAPRLSIGSATFPADATDAHALLHLATGTLYWGRLQGKGSITAYDPQVVEVLSHEERVALLEQQARLRSVLALARALDARDAYTARHSENVASYAVAIATQIGWKGDRLDLLRVAGQLHDVGKIGVRDSTLRKSERLTDREWNEMREHPVLGARMIADVAPEVIVPWVLSHHERPDGRGYPQALEGDAIPDGARILAVADTFDAMTSSRSYRRALSPVRALEELVGGAGTQFDTEAVKGFLRAVHAGVVNLEAVAEAARHAPGQEAHEPEAVADPEFTAPVVALPAASAPTPVTGVDHEPAAAA